VEEMTSCREFGVGNADIVTGFQISGISFIASRALSSYNECELWQCATVPKVKLKSVRYSNRVTIFCGHCNIFHCQIACDRSNGSAVREFE
jgi:hypothetical protein